MSAINSEKKKEKRQTFFAAIIIIAALLYVYTLGTSAAIALGSAAAIRPYLRQFFKC